MRCDFEKLRLARQRKGWDQTELAFRCKVSVFTVHRVETGKTKGIETIMKLCKVLGLKSSEIMLPEERKTA